MSRAENELEGTRGRYYKALSQVALAMSLSERLAILLKRWYVPTPQSVVSGRHDSALAHYNDLAAVVSSWRRHHADAHLPHNWHEYDLKRLVDYLEREFGKPFETEGAKDPPCASLQNSAP